MLVVYVLLYSMYIPANNISISQTPVVITYGTPNSVETDLHATFVLMTCLLSHSIVASHQTHSGGLRGAVVNCEGVRV